MPAIAGGGAVTSISLVTDDATPAEFLSVADGDVANMTSEAQFSWTGFVKIAVGTKIQLILAGGAQGVEYLVELTAKCEAIVDGGYLAVSA